ncbi:chemotaxis protein CheA [Vibrio nitrifigilis]|uniref:histidine kinase n=1 Tax=Vibrio nitrifigilis TaxID=2789781 RepID=A0ABS0GDD1_9VIBR|nr:chemotaxis protein CheA [Vibrio nitrifigilis]MBF9000387.1 chemotaxis protein CheA [Vibrio nitrifigilis]
MENFINESRELIEHATKSFLDLENSPSNSDIINELFRAIHTVKGASGVIENIESFTHLTHKMEDILQKVRDGKMSLDSSMIDVFLSGCDQLLLWLDELETQEHLNEDAAQISKHMIGQFEAINSGSNTIEDRPQPEQANELDTVSINWLADKLGREQLDGFDQVEQYNNSLLIKYQPDPQCFFSGDDPLAWMKSVSSPLWKKVILTPDTDPFDIYQAQLTFFVLTSADETELRHSLEPIENQYELYRFKHDDDSVEEDIDKRVEYVKRIVAHQINVLRHEQSTPEIRQGTMRSVIKVYKSLCCQIIDRPEPIHDDIEPEQLVKMFERIVQSFDANRAVIETEQIAPDIPASTSVNDQIEKAKKKQIKTLKVDQEKVDLLMDLVGELIVAKNSMQYLAFRAESEFGVRKLAQDIKSEQTVISRLAEDLQSVVMQVRMVPMATVFQRYPRLIRDISKKLGKQVDLIIEGEETEADKSIVEDLSEPLVHLIRNSLDHGIEMPEERVRNGKNPTGKITLSAYTHDDSVIIKISDDGKGIDESRVRTKALENKLVDPAKLERMSQQEVINLIFEPGFSTAEAVSDLSGRGVGMDAVRSAIERNGGTLSLSSEQNKGSEVTMILPLSMTISRVMMFELADQSFAIPIETVIQTLKVDRTKDIRRVKSFDTFILRGETVPILYLKDVFQMGEPSDKPDIQPVLVVRVGDDILGLAVDKLQEGQDVIIKPLEGALSPFSIYRGAAIMGDGRVLLVLDTEEVVRHAH